MTIMPWTLSCTVTLITAMAAPFIATIPFGPFWMVKPVTPMPSAPSTVMTP